MADDPTLPVPGTIIDEKYELVGLVGRGGMGAVFEAMHLRLRQRVALKMLHPEVRSIPGSLERFEREARAAGQISSPNIARVLDVETKGTALPFIVMEFLEGADLGEELATHGRLPVTDAVDYVLQACVGVRDAHAAGIIHRDLKPANLFLARTVEGPIVKIVDFGISKITAESDGRLTAAMTTMGSPIYMSPEQLREAKDVDGRADIWGLGVILYELLAGRPPFVGTVTMVTACIIADTTPSLGSLRKDLPPGLSTVVAKALQKDPADRWPDAMEFAEALSPFASPAGQQRLRTVIAASGAVPRSRRSRPLHDPNAATIVGPSPRAGASNETSPAWSTASNARSPSRPRVVIAAVASAALAVAATGGLLFAFRPSSPPLASASASAVALSPAASPSSMPLAASTPTAEARGTAANEPSTSADRQPAPSAASPPAARPASKGSGRPPASAPQAAPSAPKANPLHL